jgi:CBS domain-containing protein
MSGACRKLNASLETMEATMKASDVMSQGITSIQPTETIAHAAHVMGEQDIGALPVVESGNVIGIVTDRDLAVRGLAEGLHGGAPVLRVMSPEVRTCCENDDLDDVLQIMSEQQIRRMPVQSEAGALVGMISIGDLARWDRDEDEVTETLRDICRPAGLHSQNLIAS